MVFSLFDISRITSFVCVSHGLYCPNGFCGFVDVKTQSRALSGSARAVVEEN